jgi:hypothetical protein
MFPDFSRNFRAPGEGRESRSYRDGRGTSGLCIVLCGQIGRLGTSAILTESDLILAAKIYQIHES